MEKYDVRSPKMRMFMKKYIAVCFGLLILTGCFKQNNVDYIDNVSHVQEIIPSGERGEGALAPDFFWFDENGDKVSFKEYTEGKVVLVSYWATWCFACKMTLPELREINRLYADKGAVVIGIVTLENTDASYRLDYVSKFISDWNLGYPMILDDDERSMWGAFGMDVGGVPTTLYIDRDGRIVKASSGSRNVESFAEELDRLLL